ncbi:MAG: DUF861 domain-containing protein [Anaerolineae bacterium]|nr:DUF861 domain-containing protein [Anaerolineae bacterium]
MHTPANPIIPLVEHWDSHPLDLIDPQERFKTSRWNYFLKDQASHVLAGYWEAEQGYEDLAGDDFDEVLHVISGNLYVTCEGKEMVAGPGATVVVRRGRPMRIAARERVRAFFICYPVPDPNGYEAAVRAAMKAKGIK